MLDKSLALQALLEINLQQALPTGGLTMFIKGWKRKATPSGRQYCQLAVSARPISEIDCGLWRTPATTEPGVSVERLLDKDGNPWLPSQRTYDKITGRVAQVGLTHEVQSLAMWPTTQARDYRTGEGHRWFNPDRSRNLNDAAAMWPTPTSRDHKDGPYCPNVPTNSLLGREVWGPGEAASGSTAQTGSKGSLNPAFPCWLMGYPDDWLFAAPPNNPKPRHKKK